MNAIVLPLSSPLLSVAEVVLGLRRGYTHTERKVSGNASRKL